MNDKFTDHVNSGDEYIARKLSQVAEETNVNTQFAAELEERLRNMQPKAGWFSTIFAQISPTLRWVVLLILLAVVLSWSIRTLVPAPQPASDNTPIIPATTTSTPAPNVIPDQSATPVTDRTGYDFRGAKLYLEQPLPESPSRAHMYLLKKDEPATREQALALAGRFGIHGEIYTAPDYVFNTTDFLISDGRQMLQVYSHRYFSYASDMAKASRGSVGKPNDNADAIIHDFLQARGMDFPFKLSPIDSYGGYGIQPLSPDGIPMQYESFTQPVIRVTLDANGQVLSLDATLIDYDQAPVGEYGIITAKEALQKVLDDSILYSKMEFFHSPDDGPQEWFREHPDNQPVTFYGYLSTRPSIDPNKPELVLLNGVYLTGNISGLESMDDFSFVKASGQFFVENGIREFNVESWDRKVTETSLTGTLSRNGDQIIFASDDGSGTQYTLTDPPADVPLDTKTSDSQLSVTGAITSGQIDWTYIQYFENYGASGGGGGNGLGFYKLNLSGTPVSFPTTVPQANTNPGNVEYIVKEGDTVAAIAEAYGTTPEKIFEVNSWLNGGVLTPGKTLIIPSLKQAADPQPIGIYTIKEGDTLTGISQTFDTTVDELIRLNALTDTNIFAGQTLSVPMANLPDQTIENVRGFLTISNQQKADGTESREYNLEVTNPTNSANFYQLGGPKLSELDPYNGLPIIVSGTLSGKTGLLSLETYSIPYPDLQFQIAKGTQRSEQLEGQTVVIFTTEEGKSYVEVIANTNQLSTSFTGYQGDTIQQEILVIPDETFGGIPVAHTYQSSIIVENGPEMEVRANQIRVYPVGDNPSTSPDYTPPNVTVNLVELVYYVSNPYYQVNDPNYSQRSPYLQPAWHFQGRYDDGSTFDVLIQALKEEFLLPEPAPGLSPG